jgi:hypothetical protein
MTPILPVTAGGASWLRASEEHASRLSKTLKLKSLSLIQTPLTIIRVD